VHYDILLRHSVCAYYFTDTQIENTCFDVRLNSSSNTLIWSKQIWISQQTNSTILLLISLRVFVGFLCLDQNFKLQAYEASQLSTYCGLLVKILPNLFKKPISDWLAVDYICSYSWLICFFLGTCRCSLLKNTRKERSSLLRRGTADRIFCECWRVNFQPEKLL
jgi:hypothetical protein